MSKQDLIKALASRPRDYDKIKAIITKLRTDNVNI